MEISPAKVIRERILVESMRLLSLVPISVKAAMVELGFGDQVAITHFFKKLTGIPPGKFHRTR